MAGLVVRAKSPFSTKLRNAIAWNVIIFPWTCNLSIFNNWNLILNFNIYCHRSHLWKSITSFRVSTFSCTWYFVKYLKQFFTIQGIMKLVKITTFVFQYISLSIKFISKLLSARGKDLEEKTPSDSTSSLNDKHFKLWIELFGSIFVMLLF